MNPMIEACESRRLMSHTLTTAQRSAMNQLASELIAFHGAHKIPQSVVKAVYNDLLQTVKLAHVPGTTASKKAIADATAALKDGVATSKERTLLAGDVTSVLRSAGISKTLARTTGTDVNTLFQAARITAADVRNVFGTLVAIGESFK